MKWIFFLIALVLIVACLSITTMSPREKTNSTMIVIERRIISYVKSTKKMPVSLTDLPEIENFNNSIVDGWGNEIIYQFNNDGVVTLVSYGENADSLKKENHSHQPFIVKKFVVGLRLK